MLAIPPPAAAAGEEAPPVAPLPPLLLLLRVFIIPEESREGGSFADGPMVEGCELCVVLVVRWLSIG